MPVYKETNFRKQDPASYKAAIDHNFMSLKNCAMHFQVEARDPSSMTVWVNPGRYASNTSHPVKGRSFTLNSPAEQARSDLIVLQLHPVTIRCIHGIEGQKIIDDNYTVPFSCVPLAAIHLTPGQLAITQGHIKDLRPYMIIPEPASTRRAGIIEVATAKEVQEGDDYKGAVTPVTLKAYMEPILQTIRDLEDQIRSLKGGD